MCFRIPPFFAFQSPAVLSIDSAAHNLPIDVSSRFGRRLRELRRQRSLSELRVGIDFRIDRSYLSDGERGKRSISLPFLALIAHGMDSSLSNLLQDLEMEAPDPDWVGPA